jgi:hypothetical protein
MLCCWEILPGMPVNEKNCNRRRRFPATRIVRGSFFLPLPILLGQSICNVRSRTVCIVALESRVRNVRNWDILQREAERRARH